MNEIKKVLPQIEIEPYQNQLQDFYEYTQKSKSKNSLTTYRFAWTRFETWCKNNCIDLFHPPAGSCEALVGMFISAMAKERCLKVASLVTYLAGIKYHYQQHGIAVDISNTHIKQAMRGIRRELGTKQRQVKPLTTEDIKTLIDSIPDQPEAKKFRNRALILLGFTGAFRRSELLAIDYEHLTWSMQGLSIFIPCSKTDQEGEGRVIDIPFSKEEKYCPIRCLRTWIDHAEIKGGPVFLSIGKGNHIKDNRLCLWAIRDILKGYCAPFGFEADVSSHSLRAGHVTSSIRAGTPETWIMRQTGHRNINTLRKYERMNREFDSNSAKRLGL